MSYESSQCIFCAAASTSEVTEWLEEKPRWKTPLSNMVLFHCLPSLLRWADGTRRGGVKASRGIIRSSLRAGDQRVVVGAWSSCQPKGKSYQSNKNRLPGNHEYNCQTSWSLKESRPKPSPQLDLDNYAVTVLNVLSFMKISSPTSVA